MAVATASFSSAVAIPENQSPAGIRKITMQSNTSRRRRRPEFGRGGIFWWSATDAAGASRGGSPAIPVFLCKGTKKQI
jgi:hypothetical protein